MENFDREGFIKTLLESSPVAVSDAQADTMAEICRLLLEKNEVMNLTAVRDASSAATLHFADSLYALTVPEVRGSVLDVGSGGGFPAFPVAVCGGFDVTALDATAKKLAFISETAAACGINNIKTLCGRAEELSRLPAYRERYDCVLSRGVARLNKLCEWCLPFVRTGGVFVAMKGSRGDEEAAEAARACEALGGYTPKLIRYSLPDGRDYVIAVIRKIKSTPREYPRRNSAIEKKPL